MPARSETLTDDEFIDFCYRKILQRGPDVETMTSHRLALGSRRMSRSELVIQLLSSAGFESREANQEFVPPGHFYSAVPSAEDRRSFVLSSPPGNEILGVRMNERRQIELLGEFKVYHDSCPFPEHKTASFRYYFENPAYSYTDGLTLYSMIRKFKPRRIVEIGSGFSSCAMLDTSELYFDNKIEFTFIEPYPELLLSSLRDSDDKSSVIRKRVQDVSREVFSGLREDDILFVDSTHVSKLGSDVNRIVFEIVASVRPGVLVHFHDIFWPFDYPEDWIRAGRAWNEAYLLRAFLQFNDSFEILFFADYMFRFHLDRLRQNLPLYLKHSGGNIWLRRVRE